MVTLRYWIPMAFVFMPLLRGPLAATVEPLNNGYSSVPPTSAAVINNMPAAPENAQTKAPLASDSEQSIAPAPLEGNKASAPEAGALAHAPRLSMRVEREVDDVLSRKDGVSAAVGAALTATLTSNPAAVLVGGLAGIWVGDKRSPGCDCEPMQLGEKASSLFRTVSKTIFKGGRYLYDGTKKIANKTGGALVQMRDVNSPMPLPGQEPAIAADAEAHVPAKTAKTKPTAALPAELIKQARDPAASAQKPKNKMPKKTAKTQPPVISSVGAKKLDKARQTSAAKPASKKAAGQALHAESETKKTSTVANVEKTKAAVTAPKKPAATPQAVSAVKRAEQQAKEPMKTAKPAVRASSKKLQAMPKLAVAETLASNDSTGADDQQWPEQSVTLDREPAPVRRVLKAQSAETDASSRAYNAPAAEGQVQAAQPASQAPDCDQGGDKIARGRLAWMECYYRME